MLNFMKSTRSIAVIIVLLTISAALFAGRIDSKDYFGIATIIVTSYFVKRDSSTPDDSERQG